MAYTTSVRYTTVFGNKRRVATLVTADAVSGVIDSGLSVIEGFSLGPVSMATAAAKFKINELTAATASNGKLHISDVASGDVFQVVCDGR